MRIYIACNLNNSSKDRGEVKSNCEIISLDTKSAETG